VGTEPPLSTGHKARRQGEVFSLEAAVIDCQNVLEVFARQTLLLEAFVYRLHREKVNPLPSTI
jgi:hypothetical protein